MDDLESVAAYIASGYKHPTRELRPLTLRRINRFSIYQLPPLTKAQERICRRVRRAQLLQEKERYSADQLRRAERINYHRSKGR